MTNQEQKLLAEIEASNGTLYFDVVYWNVSLEYKTNKRRHQAMMSLAEKGLVVFEEEYAGKSMARAGRTATWECKVVSAEKVEKNFNFYKEKLTSCLDMENPVGENRYPYLEGKKDLGKWYSREYKKLKAMMQKLGKVA